MCGRKVDWYLHPNRREMVKAYMALAKFANFKVGDRVKVVRDWEKGELGCPCVAFVDDLVGRTGVITEDYLSVDGSVIIVDLRGEWAWVPFFAIELIEPAEERAKNTAERKEIDEGASKRLWKKGKQAWSRIESATEWVEELRGNAGQKRSSTRKEPGVSAGRADWVQHPHHEEMSRAYMILARLANFKVCDKVRVARDGVIGGLGCPRFVNVKLIGRTGIIAISHLCRDGTLGIDFDGSIYWVPFHALELIVPAEETIKVTVERGGEKKIVELTEEEWAKVEKTVN